MSFKKALFIEENEDLDYPRVYHISAVVDIMANRVPDYYYAEKAMRQILDGAIRESLGLDKGRIITITEVELIKQDSFYDYYEIEVRIEEDNRRELEIKAEYFERENEKLRNQLNELLFEKYESERFG